MKAFAHRTAPSSENNLLMMKAKYLLSMLLCGTMLCGTTACSKDGVDETAQEKPATTSKYVKIGVWNVGHFNTGALGGYQGDDVDEALNRWKLWLTLQHFDIFGINEWNPTFDKDGKYDATAELLRPLYKNMYFGRYNLSYQWVYNGVATNYELDYANAYTINFAHPQYDCIVIDAKIQDKTVTLIIGHIPWQNDPGSYSHDNSLPILKAEMKKHERFIYMSDMNATKEEQLSFAAEGYHIANGANGVWYPTIVTSTTALDQIITSPNIRIMESSSLLTGLQNGDHRPVMAVIQLL